MMALLAKPDLAARDAEQDLVALEAKLGSMTFEVELDSAVLEALEAKLGSVVGGAKPRLEYPVMEEYLKPTAQIVHSPTFESAAIKVMSSRPVSSAESKTLEPFRRPEGSEPIDEEPAAGFANQILRRAKKPRTSQRRAVDYVPLLGAISPTSNRCERLFSECKYVLESHRASMRSATFERLMFLKPNRELWNASTLVP
ncbi:uncharacterized protein IUM83_04768 [Phytophthora cinnamomi]|uniref:uncharacterized protein n=1 Tax=Phytophthora cinnamomi TaxID=4785 RepID=UPI0035598B9D|nr:hypothetical protein IUM83_04768 [Phytophthora cinnamomi]